MFKEGIQARTVSLRICSKDPEQNTQCLKIGFPASPELALDLARAAQDVLPATRGSSFIEEQGAPAREAFPPCHECREEGVIFQRIEKNETA